MNKKGDLVWFGIILFVVSMSMLIAASAYNTKEYNSACKNLGFEKYEHKEDFDFCEDFNSNLHYIKMECQEKFTFFYTDCIAKEISVGDVRVLG